MDPMTVVIVTNNMGEICQIYSALPVRVIKMDGMGHGGELLVENAASMPATKVEQVAAIVKKIDEPYSHLDHIQLDRIDQVAVDALTDSGSDGGFRRSIMSKYVEKLTVAEKLDCVSSDWDELPKELGFDPATGADVPENDHVAEELKKPCTLNWGRGRIKKVWHVCMSEAKSVYPGSTDKFKKTMFHVNTACGLKDAIIVGQPTAIDCTDQPAFSPGSSSVCPECVKYRLQKTYPEAT